MPLEVISQSTFERFIQDVPEKSFLQSSEMAALLSKRGYQTRYVGLKADGQLQVAGLVFTMPMTGGLLMEINSGPVVKEARYLKDFYQELQDYAKEEGALELVVKPYDTYQTFTSDGQPLGEEKPELIDDLVSVGYQHDGLQTGYPDGEPDWHYVKDLSGLDQASLFKSFSKKGGPLVKKALSFGIKVRRLKREELHLFKEITASTSDRREYADKSLTYYEDFYDSFGEACEFVVASLNFKDYHAKLTQDRAAIQATIDQLDANHVTNPDSAKYKKERQQLEKQMGTFDKRLQEAVDLIQTYADQDVILAGSLFIYTPQETVYLFSGSYTEFNRFYAPAVLQEHVMQESIKRGISFYTFLGIQGLFDGTDGVLRFKQNFNGYIVRKMGTFLYHPRPLRYKAIAVVKRLLGRR